MFAADGYELLVRDVTRERVVVEIKAGPEACADCLVPKEMMRAQFEAALGGRTSMVELVYPGDQVVPRSCDGARRSLVVE
jgi:hypothetical protein